LGMRQVGVLVDRELAALAEAESTEGTEKGLGAGVDVQVLSVILLRGQDLAALVTLELVVVGVGKLDVASYVVLRSVLVRAVGMWTQVLAFIHPIIMISCPVHSILPISLH